MKNAKMSDGTVVFESFLNYRTRERDRRAS